MTAETKTLTRKAEIAHAVKIDTEVARLWGEFHVINDKMNGIAKQIERQAEFASKPYNQTERRQAEYAERIARLEAELGELREPRELARQTALDYDKANYGGWNRFFHVVHIHKSMHCSSFRPTTKVGWLPQLSGRTEAEAVAEQGESLCTICYPSAPVALTVKQADPNACEGSGKPYSKEYSTGRERHHYGRAGYCPVCLRWQTVTASGVMRKHKKDDETRRHALDKR